MFVGKRLSFWSRILAQNMRVTARNGGNSAGDPLDRYASLAVIQTGLASMHVNSTPGLLKQLVWLTPAFMVITIAGVQPYFPIGELMRDPYAVAWSNSHEYKLHYGALSTAGLFIWAGAAAVCLFGAALFRTTGDKNRAFAFLACGLFTSYILADDAFMIHEVVVPHFGGNEKTVNMLIATAAAMIGAKFWRFFYLEKSLLLTLAICLLGFSAVQDFIHPGFTERQVLIEEGAKFVGSWSWLGFAAATTLKQFKSATVAAPANRSRAKAFNQHASSSWAG